MFVGKVSLADLKAGRGKQILQYYRGTSPGPAAGIATQGAARRPEGLERVCGARILGAGLGVGMGEWGGEAGPCETLT